MVRLFVRLAVTGVLLITSQRDKNSTSTINYVADQKKRESKGSKLIYPTNEIQAKVALDITAKICR